MVFSLPYKTQSTASDRGSAPAWEYVLSKRPRQRRSSESKIKKKKKKKTLLTDKRNDSYKRVLSKILLEKKRFLLFSSRTFEAIETSGRNVCGQ